MNKAVLIGALAVTVMACNTTPQMELQRPADLDEREDVLDETAKPSVFNSQYKTIAFQSALSSIRRGKVVLHFPGVVIDEIKNGLCNYRHRGNDSVIEWGASIGQLGNWTTELGITVKEALTSAGIDVAGDPNKLFDRTDEYARAEYLLGARLTKLAGNLCDEHDSWRGFSTGKYAGEMQVDIDWILYDGLRKKEVGTVSTVGYGIQKKAKPSGIGLAFQSAVGDAAAKLGENPDFLKLLKKSDGTVNTPLPLSDDIIAVENNPLYASPIKNHLYSVLGSVVTIRTARAIGSGFLISDEGYILTNQHVTGDASNVQIIFNNGIEVTGKVVRRHEARDVALIKIPLRVQSPLPVRFKPVDVSDDVYAIGNLLSESLKSTVTKGVVSAFRGDNETGLKLIQADVDIHSGNSGGPLVDKNGNVVGISVKAFVAGNAPGGLNFFIPISNALEFLNIEVAAPQS